MKTFLSFFQDEQGNFSSKRFVGIIGMVIIHLCYAIRVIVYGDTTDTIALVTADTALLGVEAVTKAISNESTTNETTVIGNNAKSTEELEG